MVLPSIQTARTKASLPRVLLIRRRLLNYTSPTVRLLRHSRTFSHSTNWTILFAIWRCPRAKKSYWDQDFSRKNVRISSFRCRYQQLALFFRKEDDLVFCYEVDGLINALGIKHDPLERRLFIGCSKLSLKAVSQHNGNQHPSIPVGHAVHMKETYENINSC